MPLYSYHCQNCDNKFDAFQPMAHHAICMCPRCDIMAPQVISRPNKGTDVTGLWTNFDEPVHVRGKQHLRDLCKAQGLTAVGALD